MIIKESAENYLEAILMLKNKNGYVRSIDVAVDTDGNITLTDKGMEIAQKIYERHQVIAKALIALGVDEETAYDDSCKIEHDLSDITFQKIKEYFLSHTNENI